MKKQLESLKSDLDSCHRNIRCIDALAKEDWSGDVFQVGKQAAFAWCAKGLLESKLAIALLKGFGETCTTRNWATVEKIHALLHACG